MVMTNGMRILMRGSAMAAVAAIALPAAASAQQAVYRFDIPAQDLAGALRAFARTTKQQIVFDGRQTRQVRSSALRGNLSAGDGLTQLLRGTGFAAHSSNAGVFIVERSPSMQATAAALDGQPAQNMSPSSGGAAGGSRAEDVTVYDQREQDIVVTGTNIRGQSPIGSPLTIVTREDIEKSGFGRIEDYLETLPSNFSGSTSDDSNLNFSGEQNLGRGQGVNLRGIGSGSTLVLINGRRPAPGGLVGGFVDISSIPAQAIERIEILTDGASALYGSDAVGGVVNFILKRNYEGLETSLRIANIDSGIDEIEASVTGGFNWNGGNLIAGYAYTRRNALYNKDRSYASLNGNYTSLGGSDFRTTFANPGTIVRTGQPSYAIPAGQDGTALTVAQLTPGVNYSDTVSNSTALPDQQLHSFFASISHQLSSTIRLFADGRFSQRRMYIVLGASTATLNVPSTNPYYVNPYGGTAPVQVRYDFSGIAGKRPQNAETSTFGFNGGAEVELGPKWHLNLTGSYGWERNRWDNLNGISSSRRNACLSGVATPAQCPGRPLNVFGDGRGNDPVTVDFIRQGENTNAIAKLTNITAIVDGPLFALPAGDVKLALGADYRKEDLNVTGLIITGGVATAKRPIINSRDVWAAFGELSAPILGNRDRTLLEASLAGRYERYSDFGSTFDPKVGINFIPIDGLAFRASWSTSFRAPRFSELISNPSSGFVDLPDEQSPTTITSVLYIANEPVPNLGPETAETWTIGFDAKPAFLPGLTMSATYFQLNYTNKIVDLAIVNPFDAPTAYASIINRNPTQGQVDAICGRPNFIGSCPALADVDAIIDRRIQNLAVVAVRGIDFNLGYRVEASFGNLNFGVAGTRLFRHSLAASSSDVPASVLNTFANPLKWKLRGTSGWSHEGWSLNAAVNFSNAYLNPAGNQRIGSWTTVDAGIAYDVPGDGWKKGLTLRLFANNLFDKAPPFVDILAGYDGANGNQTGRSVSLSISKRW